MNKTYLAAIVILINLLASCSMPETKTATADNSSPVKNGNTAAVKELPAQEKVTNSSASPTASQKSNAPHSAVALTEEFNADMEAAKAKYLDKPIKVEGKIKELTKIEDGDMVMVIQGRPETKVQCAFKPEHPQFKYVVSKLKVGDSVAVDGELVIAMKSSLLIHECKIIL